MLRGKSRALQFPFTSLFEDVREDLFLHFTVKIALFAYF